ncbi:sugar ABC transporter substrate-binding protein [Gulosibacter sp. ACHW.36C]|uniref:Sugar ABC transporter substrate-binding protein n=1 Tax=Gulosibacter sediminis TaxID=1729695 RepID=A0ABY4N0P7_9MICO|nr:sugar ABC transporter substrate-binding protein [Gulosibacter sediminis]UQN15068.1 sugar ABC transporter substrate-binding protein [Gulosibacter sediminis]
MSVHKRLLSALAALATSTILLSACASGSPGAGGGDSYTIGVVVLDLQDPDLAHMTEAMQAEADTRGVELKVTDSKKDVSTELNQVEDLITQQVDAIVLQPLDGEASQNAAQRVIDSEIPLFVLSTEFADGADIAYESYIGIDDTLAGEMQAEYLNEVLPDGGNVVFAAGTYGASWTDRRITGYENKINDNITTVAEFQGKGSRDEAKRNMEDVLQRFGTGEIDAVVANNDEMALGASSAIEDAGRTDEFQAIVGVDGTQPAIAAIQSGTMTATVQQDSAGQGEKTIEVVQNFLDGKDIEDRYTLPFTLITEENAADFAE